MTDRTNELEDMRATGAYRGKRITLQDMLDCEPCYTNERVIQLWSGLEDADALELVRHCGRTVPPQDYMWLFFRLQMLPKQVGCELLARIAEAALPAFDARHPTDDRPKKAIEAIRQYAIGDISIDQLSKVGNAAAYAEADACAANAAAAYAAYAYAAAYAAVYAAAATAAAYVVAAATAATPNVDVHQIIIKTLEETL